MAIRIGERVETERAKLNGSQEAYQRLGGDLIEFEFKDVQPNLAAIYERLHALGSDVGFLVTRFNDRVLVDESFSRLGRLRHTAQNPPETIFEPSERLRSVPYMDQLTLKEWLVGYARYQEGLLSSAFRSVSPVGVIPSAAAR